MAKSTKRRAAKPKSQGSDEAEIQSDEELMASFCAEIRQQLSYALSKYIIGPIEEPQAGDVWLRLADGNRYYRVKSGLDDRELERCPMLCAAAQY
jgi:hypothetical protein